MLFRFLILIVYICFNQYTAWSQVMYDRPKLENSNSWSVIMIPDIQCYTRWTQYQPIMDVMFAWIEDNIDSLNIKMVVTVGDLIQSPQKIVNDFDGNKTTQQQWEYVSKVFARLDGKVPYIAATGNHDYSINKEGQRTSRFKDFFNTERNFLNQKILVQNTRNEDGIPSLENAAYELKNVNGRDYLFLTVEYGPRDTVMSWARRIAALEQYKNHRIILVTHNYLNNRNKHTSSDVTWVTWEPYNINNVIQRGPLVKLPAANNGLQIWEKLVKVSSNIEMVLCGHVSGDGYRMDKNDAGKKVHQILFDSQSMGGGGRYGNGGDGWIRILEFFPDNKTVKLKTFSPLFALSPTTQPYAWKKDERNEFTMYFD